LTKKLLSQGVRQLRTRRTGAGMGERLGRDGCVSGETLATNEVQLGVLGRTVQEQTACI